MKSQLLTSIFLRFSLSASYLSAVADRFGLWGAPGTEGVFWGNFQNFNAYTQTLNPLLPELIILPLSWFVTILEILLGILLIFNIKPKLVGYTSAGLLALFAIAMITNLGLKASLDYSVFTACAASMALVTLKSKTN